MRAQSSLGLFLNYGWAVLVIIIATATIFYINGGNPVVFNLGKCEFPGGIRCIDKPSLAPTGQVSLAFRNNYAFPITLSPKLSGTGDCPEPSGFYVKVGNNEWQSLDISNTNPISTNDLFLVRFECGTQTDDVFSSDVTLWYENKDSGLERPVTGKISGKI